MFRKSGCPFIDDDFENQYSMLTFKMNEPFQDFKDEDQNQDKALKSKRSNISISEARNYATNNSFQSDDISEESHESSSASGRMSSLKEELKNDDSPVNSPKGFNDEPP